MPVEEIIDHPGFIALPAAGRGMLFTLILYLWQTGFRELPTAENELLTISRAHFPTWFKHKVEIKKILSDLSPTLAEAYAHAEEVYQTQVYYAREALAKTSRSRMEKKQVRHGSREEARTVRSTEEREAAPPARAGEERPKFRRRTMG